MIHFILGKPGGGKSYLTVELYVLRVLQHDTRDIVTNMELKLGGIADTLQKRGSDANPFSRIRMIDDEQAKEFYRYRGSNAEPLEVSDDPESPGILPGQDLGGGVVYVIDEAHIPFDSHRWGKISRGVLWYASQHRKVSDDVILVTQYIDNVAKQLRVLAQDFTVVRNRRKEKYGVFSLGAGFEYYIYLQKPTGSANDSPNERHTLDVDWEGVGACYDTSAGVGIRGLGKDADKGDKRKGVPIWTLWVGVLALIVGMLYGINQLPRWLNKKVRRTVVPEVSAEEIATTDFDRIPETLPPPPPAEKSDQSEKPAATWSVSSLQIETENILSPLYVRGWIMKGGTINVVLSNGVTVTERDGTTVEGLKDPTKGVVRIERNFVEFTDGQRLPIGNPNERSQVFPVKEVGNQSPDKAEAGLAPQGALPASLPEISD